MSHAMAKSCDEAGRCMSRQVEADFYMSAKRKKRDTAWPLWTQDTPCRGHEL